MPTVAAPAPAPKNNPFTGGGEGKKGGWMGGILKKREE
jgi:hypothetical protein